MRTLLFFLFIFRLALAAAQQPQAPVLDTLPPAAASATTPSPPVGKAGLVRRMFTNNYPNPRTAAFLSLALPGAGQAYNRKWWKLPIVYAVLGGLTYLELDNIGEYNRLKKNYKLLVDGDPATNPTEAPYNQLDATSMKQYRDQWRRYVEQSSVALGLAYILTATEAFVDAHLARFDVSDDLSLRPRVHSTDAGPVFGIGLSLRFGRPQPKGQLAPP
ncbi:MAG: hypothetical protein IPH12_05530 [Saprospirales bacterium]|jgi:hypothetical protein|nr:hypothetical protein [Saprospirales bacterium]MBK8923074.1 hypothetical protein [Saprospirales bacterium]